MFTIIGILLLLLAVKLAWKVTKFLVYITILLFILDLITGGFAILVTVGGTIMFLLSPVALWIWLRNRPKRLAEKREEEAYMEERRRRIEAEKKGLWYY